jgi:hypothetical protein
MYLTRNRLNLRYKDQTVNAVRETIEVCCDNLKKQINSVGGMQNFSFFKQMVHIVTVGLYRVNQSNSTA